MAESNPVVIEPFTDKAGRQWFLVVGNGEYKIVGKMTFYFSDRLEALTCRDVLKKANDKHN